MQLQLGTLTLQPRRQLLSEGRRLPLGRRALDILSLLAEAKGEIVTKEEILDTVWPGVIVEENAIHVHVAALRKALGKEAYRLTTVRSLGYRLDVPEQPSPVLADREHKSIAVLPFANLSGDSARNYVPDGLVRELIATLWRHSELKVAAWQSAKFYNGRATDIRTVARQLGVETVVEGWVKFDGERVRVNAELTDANTGHIIWTETYDRELGNLLSLDGDLASSIASALRAQMSRSSPHTSNAEAFDCYLKGKALIAQAVGPNTEPAQEYFRRALQLDRKFAKASAALAQAHFNPALMGIYGRDKINEGLRHAERALALDPTLIEGHNAMALLALKTGDWQMVEDHSGLEDICPARATFLATVGYVDQAVIQAECTVDNNPLCADNNSNCAMFAWLVGDQRSVARWTANAIASGASACHPPLSNIGAELDFMNGEYLSAANLAAVPFDAANCGEAARETFLRCYHAMAGEGAADLALASLRRLAATPEVQASIYRLPAVAGVLLYFLARLRDLDTAYQLADGLVAAWADTGCVDQPSLLYFWPHDMNNFRADPRFLGLARKLGFVDFWRRYGLPASLNAHPWAGEFIGDRTVAPGR